MKKSIIVALSVLLCLCMLLFAGCKGNKTEDDTTATDSTQALDAVATTQEDSTEASTELSTELSTESTTAGNSSQTGAVSKKPVKVTEPKVDTSKTLNSYTWNGNGTYKCGNGSGYLVPGVYYLQKTASTCTVTITNGQKDENGESIGLENVDIPYNVFLTMKAGYTIKINGGKIIHSSKAVVPGANSSNGMYGEGSYRVGTDIPAGEYLLYSTANSSTQTATCIAYRNADPFAEDPSLRAAVTLNPFYFTLKAGEIIEIDDGKLMIAPKGAIARPDSNGAYDDTCMYKVGKDIKPGTYQLVPDSASTSYAYIIYKDSYYQDNDMIVKEDMDAKGTVTVTLKSGQYIDFYGAKLVPAKAEETSKPVIDDPVTDVPLPSTTEAPTTTEKTPDTTAAPDTTTKQES